MANGRLDRPEEAMDVALGLRLPARVSVPRSFCTVLRVLRVFLTFSGFKGWQTAGLDAHKKPLMWPWGACWLRD